jgi:hypothetical protein
MSFTTCAPLKILVLATTASIALSACASTQFGRSEQSDRDRFDPQAVAWSKKPGKNSIAGTAELTTRAGTTKTCAGLEVRLVPDAPYTRDRVAMLYGTTDEGFVNAAEAKEVQERSEAVVDPAYKRSHKVSTCDAKGHFAFTNLADGSYYVLAPVVWRAAGNAGTDGGFLMQRVDLAGGKSKRLHMTPQTRISSR